jgi:hypothetical protein
MRVCPDVGGGRLADKVCMDPHTTPLPLALRAAAQLGWMLERLWRLLHLPERRDS